MDSIMNKAAFNQIITECDVYLNARWRESDAWRQGFHAAVKQVVWAGTPIADACDAEYGDAGGPVMNQAALVAIWAAVDRLYEANRDSGYSQDRGLHDLWLLGVAAGMQRFEMHAGDIVADCT